MELLNVLKSYWITCSVQKSIHLKNGGRDTSLLRNGRATLIADIPKKWGGKYFGFSPDELLIAALVVSKAATLKALY